MAQSWRSNDDDDGELSAPAVAWGDSQMSRYNDDGETSKKAPAFNTRSAKSVITGCDDKDGTKTGTVPHKKEDREEVRHRFR